MRPKRFLSLWYVWRKLCTYLAPTLTDMNPLGFMDDLSMRGVRSLDLVDGDDVHGPTTSFQDRALATDTPPPKAVTILWSATTSH